ASRLQSAESSETNVRFVLWSVNRIGSRVTSDVSSGPTLVQVAAPVASLKPETRSVSTPACIITLPLAQFAPIDGSPASRPSGAGAAKFVNAGTAARACAAKAANVTASAAARQSCRLILTSCGTV